LIVCDLDGTLIGRGGGLETRDVDALARARTAGLHVTISTGRNFAESRHVVDALGLRGPGIFVNGAAIADMPSGRPLSRCLLAPDLVDEAITLLGGLGHSVLLLSEHAESGWPRYLTTRHGPPHASTLAWLKHHDLESEEWTGRGPPVLRVGVVVDPCRAARVTGAITGVLGARVSWHCLHSPHFDCAVIEVLGPRVSKWNAVEQVCAMLDVPPTAAVCIGDDENDVPMLSGASLSFAMATASDSVRSAAKHVTGAQSECGVAQVVESLLAGAW
jgi:Cof subfamily protein (haloacid dehalogenase superfamily)